MAKTISHSKRLRVYDRDGFRCSYCKVMTTFFDGEHSPNHAVLDHIIPKSRGGTSDEENLQLLCSQCNSRKGKKTMEEFLEYMRASEMVEEFLADISIETTPELEESLTIFNSKVPANHRITILNAIKGSELFKGNLQEPTLTK